MSEIYEKNGIKIHYGGHTDEALSRLIDYHEGIVIDNTAVVEFLRKILEKRKEIE